MALDLPTLFFVVAALTLLMSFWVGLMCWGKPKGDPMRPWALAMLTYAAADILVGLRDLIGLTASVLLANGMGAASLALMFVAVRRSQGHRLMGHWWVLLPTLLLPLALLPLMDDYRTRILLVTLTFAAQSAAVLWALRDRPHPRHGRGRYILLSSFAFLELTLLLRFASVSLGWVEVSSLTDGNRWQALMFFASSCAVMSIALGFVYMEFERIEQQSLTLAMKDMLTGLSNRRAISEELQVAVARAQRHGQCLSVLLLDIDHFKRVNDSFGHQAGDAVLRAVAQVLQSRLRGQDRLGRFGGEEFLLVLPDTTLDGALILAEALRAAVATDPMMWGAHSIALTVSVGVRAGAITGIDTPDSLVAAADAAMYRAKQGGRNRIEVIAPISIVPAAGAVASAA